MVHMMNKLYKKRNRRAAFFFTVVVLGFGTIGVRDTRASAVPGSQVLSRSLNAIPLSFVPAASDYENKAVANVKSSLNLRAAPSIDGKVLGVCYRGGGGEVLEKRDGWTKIRSGSLEGWLSSEYLVFGRDIQPLAQELGLFSAKVTAQTLNIREKAATDAPIVGQAASGESYPVLNEADGWIKIQFSADRNGYISGEYARVLVTPGRAVTIEEEQAALQSAGSSSQYVVKVSDDEIYLLAAVSAMETADDDYSSHLAVVSVIVNRVRSGRWGGTVSDVIYAAGQFPGATSGLLDRYLAKGPSANALKATRDALCGISNIGDYLYFNSIRAADYGSYASYVVVGGNCFYKK